MHAEGPNVTVVATGGRLLDCGASSVRFSSLQMIAFRATESFTPCRSCTPNLRFQVQPYGEIALPVTGRSMYSGGRPARVCNWEFGTEHLRTAKTRVFGVKMGQGALPCLKYLASDDVCHNALWAHAGRENSSTFSDILHKT